MALGLSITPEGFLGVAILEFQLLNELRLESYRRWIKMFCVVHEPGCRFVFHFVVYLCEFLIELSYNY